MTNPQLREQIASMLDKLPEPKLEVVLDFVQFLAERAEREAESDWASAQSQSAGYQEWVSDANDVYDQLFTDTNPAR